MKMASEIDEVNINEEVNESLRSRTERLRLRMRNENEILRLRLRLRNRMRQREREEELAERMEELKLRYTSNLIRYILRVENDDPWAQLGVSERANKTEIKSVWRSLVRQLHPDKAANKLKTSGELIAAFSIVCNAKRALEKTW